LACVDVANTALVRSSDADVRLAARDFSSLTSCTVTAKFEKPESSGFQFPEKGDYVWRALLRT
jgi:hypothetical protein